MNFSEDEILTKNQIAMYQYTKLLNNGKLTIDELSGFFPGFLHVNSLEEVKLHFCSKKTLDFLEIDIDEVKMNGSKILKSHLHPNTFRKVSTSLCNINIGRENVTTSYQQIRPPNTDTYKWYYSVKRILNKHESFSITQPISVLGKSTRLIQKFLELEPWLEKKYYPFLSLTDREREIFKLVASGKSTNRIADILFISSQTVNTHRKTIYRKLQIKSITELVRIADYYS